MGGLGGMGMYDNQVRNEHSYVEILLIFSCFILYSRFPYYSDARRLPHDTWLASYPFRAYLGDYLRGGIFPFWDPFSNLGLPTGADISGRGNYYPVAIIFGLIFTYTPQTFLIEVAFTSLIALSGTYSWLRRYDCNRLIAATGALIYAGCGTYQNAFEGFSAQVSMAYLPWLLLGIDFIVRGPYRYHHFGGIVFSATAGALMLVGGYAGLNYVMGIFSIVYAISLATICAASRIGRVLLFGSTAVILICALTFLPFSEFLNAFIGQFSELRGFNNAEDAFLQYQQPLGLFSLIFANASILGNGTQSGIQPGWGQDYIGICFVTLTIYGWFTGHAKKIDWLFIALAVFIFLISTGPKSWVAQFFVYYVPGFGSLRWHYEYTAIALLFLIGAEARISQRVVNCWRAEGLRPQTVILLAAGLLCSGFGAALYSRRAFMASISLYELLIPIFLVAIALGFCFFTIGREHWSKAKKHHHDIYALGALLAFGILFSVILRIHLLTSQAGLDQITILSGVWWSFTFDTIQSGLCIAALCIALQKHYKFSADFLFRWILLITLFDMTLASNRYFEGGPYWRSTQAPLVDEARNASNLFYTSNNRDIVISNRPDNIALLIRHPALRSYGPTFSPSVRKILIQPNGQKIFERLVWLVSPSAKPNVDNWLDVAKIPEIKSLQLSANELVVTLVVPQPSILVWTDKIQSGWSVDVNGENRKIIPVLGVLKGVEVSAGMATVKFQYRPPYLISGVIFLGLGTFSIAIFLYLFLRGLFLQSQTSLGRG
jgi:membrane protein YfhO